jgi:hypothetical protein
MALNYTVHSPGTITNGARSAPPVHEGQGAVPGQFGLATGTPSADITGPCELRLFPDERQRIDIRKKPLAGNALDSANSSLVIAAGVDSWFILRAGTYQLQWTAG